MENSEIRSAIKDVAQASTVFVYAQASGVHFSVSKQLAKTILNKAQSSQNFNYKNTGTIVTLYI